MPSFQKIVIVYGMYDDIEIKLDSNEYSWPDDHSKPFNYNGIIFVPKYNRYGQFTNYTASLKNIILNLSPGSLTIKNSIHKYLNGNNYSDLTLSDVSYLAGDFIYNYGIDIREAKLKKISYAVNITVNDPDEICRGMVSYKSRPFEPMRYKSQVYGLRYPGAEFRTKLYNKTAETKFHYREDIPKNIFRIENEIWVMRCIQERENNPIPVYVFRDLYNYDFARKILNDLIERYKTILKIPDIMKANLNTKELRILATFNSPEHLKYLKEHFPDTYKKDRDKVKDIMTNKFNNSVFDEIEEKIRQKSEVILSR